MQADIDKMPKVSGGAGAYISPRLKRVFELPTQEAERLKDEYISTEHLLIGIAAEGGTAAQDACRRRRDS